jgi:hypothetical protein
VQALVQQLSHPPMGSDELVSERHRAFDGQK